MRGLEPARVHAGVELLAEKAARCSARNAPLAATEAWEDAFVLAFNTRDVRSGKGERDLFRELFLALGARRPDLALAALPFVPAIGYWEDVNRLAAATAPGAEHASPKLYEACLELTLAALKRDEAKIAEFAASTAAAAAAAAGAVAPAVAAVAAVAAPAAAAAAAPPRAAGPSGLSLVAKYAPREAGNKAADRALAAALADRLAPGDAQRHAQYRKRVAAVNRVLGTVEVTMCAEPSAWATINPGTVPGRALQKYRAAFFNEGVPVTKSSDGKVTGHSSRKRALTSPDRVAAAARFSDHIERAARGEAGFTIKAADVVYPHEIVRAALELVSAIPQRGRARARALADAAINGRASLLEAQWRAIVSRAQASGALGRMLAMCDVSGSMSGTPMEVSIALGMLIAECSTGAFANSVLTFDSVPRLVTFAAGATFLERVAQLSAAPWGMSTDFQAACNLVLRTLAEQRVAPGEEPTHLVVLTDM